MKVLQNHRYVYRTSKVFILSIWNLCLLLFPLQSLATELLIEGKTAEIKVDMVSVKAGAGVAFVDKGRLYRGDLVKILNKNNLSHWVHIQSGRLKGYIPLKVLRFDTRAAEVASNPEMIRRLEEYQYDEKGRRIKVTGERVGSGETQRGPRSADAKQIAYRDQPVRLKVGLGIGRFERRFSSNAPLQSILNQVQAQPVVLTSLFQLNYLLNDDYVLSARFLDYRMGLTELKTSALNDGVPFDLENEGQLFDLAGLVQWSQTNVDLLVGPAISIQRHSFQETAPIPVFLTSVTTNVGLQTSVKAKITGAAIAFTAMYARAVTSSQSPQTSGALSSGRLWCIRSEIEVPLRKHLALMLEGVLSSEEIERLGASTQIDTVTDPARPLTYNASKEENRLSAVLIGIKLKL